MVCRQIQNIKLEGLHENQNRVFYLAKIFHHGPHWFRHVCCRSVLARQQGELPPGNFENCLMLGTRTSYIIFAPRKYQLVAALVLTALMVSNLRWRNIFTVILLQVLMVSQVKTL